MIAAGYSHSLALKKDGTVWAWGQSKSIPIQISGLSDVTMIAAGYSHSLALKKDCSVWAWGHNNYGELGDGSIANNQNPVQVSSLSHVARITAGDYISLALKDNGSVWTWGDNRYSQIGYGYPTYLPEPVFSPIQFNSKTMTTSPNKTISIPVINTSQKNITFSYSTTDETAIAGIDYLTTSGSLTFQADEIQKDIQITILNNPDSQNDKTFVLNLDASDDVFLNDGSQAIITISSDNTVNSPYTQTFSQNMPASGWTYDSSTTNGRIHVTTGRLRMDTDTDQVQNLNEAILHIDFSYMDNVQLNFFQKSIASDICTSLPETYTDHFNGDGVSISNDGYTWYRIMDCTDLTTDTFGKNYTIILSATESFIKANYDENFHLMQFVKIKFQQYGNRTYPSGGREWDNISVNGTITTPIAFNDILKLTEDIETISSLNSTQECGNSLHYTIVTPPVKGNVTITDYTSGEYTYQPNSNETGEDYFTFKAINLKTEAESKPATINIYISPVNDPPVTIDVNVDLYENKYKYIKLSTSDPDNDPLTYQIIEQPSHGTVSVMNNIATYTPYTYYNGPDSFTFKASDEEFDSNISSVMLTIYPVYSYPLAYPQNVNTTEDMPINISLTGFSPDNLPLTYHLKTQPSHGILSGIPPYLTYTPETHIWGNDAFTFFVNDGKENSEPAQISITIARSEKYTLSLLTNKSCHIRINNTTVLPPWNNQFDADAPICIEAIPNVYWIFQQWTTDIDSAQNPICITMDKSKTIMANFVKQSFVLNIYGNEPIIINHQEQQLPFSNAFEIHSKIIIQTNSNRFQCWDGDIQECDDLIEFTINASMNLTPIFYPIPIWKTPIIVERQVEDSSLQYTGTINIGIASQAYTIPLKESAEFYSCDIFAYDQDLKAVGEDIHQDNISEHIWNIAVNPHGNIGSLVNEETAIIRWNILTFSPEGLYILKKGLDGTGETLIANMRNTTEYLITDKTYQGLSIIWKKYDTFIFHLNQGWNLISLPLIPENTTVNALFPDYISAFEYKDGAYVAVSELLPGKGYWIKMPSQADYQIVGNFFSNSTVILPEGCHLIGASNTDTTPTIDPDGVPVILRYVPGGYEEETTLEPGLGYWVIEKRVEPSSN